MLRRERSKSGGHDTPKKKRDDRAPKGASFELRCVHPGKRIRSGHDCWNLTLMPKKGSVASLAGRVKRCAFEMKTLYAAPSKRPNSHACPCRFWRVMPSPCPLRIMYAASIP